ncbi:DUF4192 domain-containing protein [Planotetraspora sp. A-T 1434]|uniref:DUF4192 domain-containing protein n=1 Tax=Planotetraspora sp. A-T 1434 TaxID=2979219 RepID=UPI0021BEC53C|nr:DUF4192 domain-containing protein [Planotetraspora sp. A-T 1434]MCT9931064.1 DUF4192 domain-containing protein [Planotetraspora sp. A-T 1434]
MTLTPTLTLSTPADILAAVPYLLGFHPADSLVVTGFAGSSLRLTTRWDLPPEPDDFDRLVSVLRREGVTMTILAGYGPGHLVTPVVDEATRRLSEAGIGVAESLRADDGRYWSYACHSADCCPAEGTSYDPVASPVAAEAVVHGLVALPDRHSLRRSVEPYGGAAMWQATQRVAAELRARLAMTETAPNSANGAAPDGRGAVTGAVPGAVTAAAAGTRVGAVTGDFAAEFAAEFVAEGLARVRAAIGLYASGDRLGDEAVARLGFDLSVIRIRDEAWALLDDGAAHMALWRDVTRRMEPAHVAPAASLLAAAAWRAGECALAGMALERALEADPAYSMANLLRQALLHLLSPAVLRDRMPTPEQLDEEMGPPQAGWLAPLLTLLREQPHEQPHGRPYDEEPSALAS